MKKTHRSHTAGLAGLFAAIAISVAANAATTAPTPIRTIAPKLTAEDHRANGEVRLRIDINEYGFVTEAEVANSTSATLENAALDAIYGWVFEPATENGRPVATSAIQPFHFNQGAISLTAKTAKDSHPRPSRSPLPELTSDLSNINGNVVLQAGVNAAGEVTAIEVKSSSHPELEPTALAALAKWSFKPAIKDGQAVASQVIVPFHFKGVAPQAVAAISEARPDRAPLAVRQPSPELGRDYSEQRGEARLSLVVDAHGYVAEATVLDSSDERLAVAAREAALNWKFRPALKNGTPVAAVVIQPFSFNGGVISAEQPIDRMPTVRASKTPELSEALVGIRGQVKVRLALDARGNVVSAAAAESSHDELVEPTLSAARDWKFRPAVKDGQNVPSSVLVPFVFNQKS